MTQHNVITDPEIHEPKGVSSALAGQSYIADGAGSGDWEHQVSGWGNYAHSGTEQTFNTTTAKLLINGSGPSTNQSYLPRVIRGVGALWNVATSFITPIAVGDAYNIRLQLPVTERTSTVYITVQLDVGGASTPTNVIATTRLEVDRTEPFTVSWGTTIFSLATFLANGGQIFITCDAGSIGVTNPTIFISRAHGEIG